MFFRRRHEELLAATRAQADALEGVRHLLRHRPHVYDPAVPVRPLSDQEANVQYVTLVKADGSAAYDAGAAPPPLGVDVKARLFPRRTFGPDREHFYITGWRATDIPVNEALVTFSEYGSAVVEMPTFSKGSTPVLFPFVMRFTGEMLVGFGAVTDSEFKATAGGQITFNFGVMDWSSDHTRTTLHRIGALTWAARANFSPASLPPQQWVLVNLAEGRNYAFFVEAFNGTDKFNYLVQVDAP